MQNVYFVGCLFIFFFVGFEQVWLQVLLHKLTSNIRALVKTVTQKQNLFIKLKTFPIFKMGS